MMASLNPDPVKHSNFLTTRYLKLHDLKTEYFCCYKSYNNVQFTYTVNGVLGSILEQNELIKYNLFFKEL